MSNHYEELHYSRMLSSFFLCFELQVINEAFKIVSFDLA